jgi:hypothetical protein
MKAIAMMLLLLNLVWLAWQQGWLPAGETGPQTQVRPVFVQAPGRLLQLAELSPEQLALMEEIATAQDIVAAAEARVQEVTGDIAETRDQLQEAPIAIAPEVLPTPWCAEIGPFAEVVAAQGYLAGLAALGATGESMAREEPVSSTWWVHTPPFPSEAEARLLLSELQAKGIDSYYVRTGELAGGISLGVFSRQESARIAQEQLSGQGYQSRINQIFRNAPRYYVELRLPDSAILTSPEWKQFLGVEEGVQTTEKLCEVIARENQFP